MLSISSTRHTEKPLLFLSLKNQIQRDRKNVQEEFQSLRDILDSQEKNELQKLKQEEEEILSSLSESENEQVQTSKLVGNLISEVELRLQAPDTAMLQVRLQKESQHLRFRRHGLFPSPSVLLCSSCYLSWLRGARSGPAPQTPRKQTQHGTQMKEQRLNSIISEVKRILA